MSKILLVSCRVLIFFSTLCIYIFSDWWIKFFLDAGIPSFASSKYATLFYENRIQSNMLMDLDKDILKDMGISVIGDIIAILKHAKDVSREVVENCDYLKIVCKKIIISFV